MAEKLGREATEGELYIAHFLGAGAGPCFVRLAEQGPDLRADAYFPRAARANRAIFYAEGKPRSIAQVYELLVSQYSGARVTTAAGEASQRTLGLSLPQRNPATSPSAQPVPEQAALVPSLKVAALGKTLQVQPRP